LKGIATLKFRQKCRHFRLSGIGHWGSGVKVWQSAKIGDKTAIFWAADGFIRLL